MNLRSGYFILFIVIGKRHGVQNQANECTVKWDLFEFLKNSQQDISYSPSRWLKAAVLCRIIQILQLIFFIPYFLYTVFRSNIDLIFL